MDIALISLPRLNIDAPPMSIAAIKGSVSASGYSAKCYDFNIELFKEVSFADWLDLESFFQTDLRYTGASQDGAGRRNIDFLNIIKKRSSSIKACDTYKKFVRKKLKEILKLKPKWLGVSIFSVNSIIPSILFFSELKEIAPAQKVVAGGMGLSSFGLGGSSNFGKFLKAQGLIDEYIFGEGEREVVRLLRGEEISSHPKQLDDLDALPFPDYSDFDFNLYPGRENMIYITGSRGCIRNCTFCDINSLWKKYKYRTGQSLAQEMRYGYQKYGTKDCYFTDSLINGNLKEFDNLLNEVILCKENGELPNDFMFGGQWICRPRERFKEAKYEKMSRAGVYNVSVGVESGSNAVLEDMRKGTKRSDHDFMLEMFEKYGIRANLLLLVGYPTETEEDFQKTLEMLKDYKKYSDSGTIWGVVLGKTMVVLPNTPIADNPHMWNIQYDKNGNWYSSKNSGLSYEERVRRRIVAGELCENLGYVIKSQVVTVNSLYEIVKDGGYDSIA